MTKVNRESVAHLSHASTTMLMTLTARARASQLCPELGFSDPIAEAILTTHPEISQGFPSDAMMSRTMVLRTQLFDQLTRQWMQSEPQGALIALGCGLCSRAKRVGNELTKPALWLQLDLPEVIAIRRALSAHLGEEALIASSLLDPGWLAHLMSVGVTDWLLILEGVSPYLSQDENREFLQMLANWANAKGVTLHLLMDYLHPALITQAVASHRQGQWDTPFQSGFANGTALAAQSEGVICLAEYSYFANISPAHQAMAATFQAQYACSPSGVAHLKIN